ncbi:MAG: AMP-binding protein [Rhodospirillaceae bacterium]|jgi:carnitine-CoA ligase|nr:AMP-binding protein [Rhodospirillaceae bacterium]MBT6119332.1 AMP-binding protein [Rhodospirillaceae bacterium]
MTGDPHKAGPIWSGCAEATLPALLHREALRAPDAPLLIFEDGLVVTRWDLAQRVERFAGWLAERTRPGDRMAVLLGSRTEVMVALYAAAAARIAHVSVPDGAGLDDAGHILRNSRARLVVTDSERRSLIDRLRRDCPDLEQVVVLDGAEPDGLGPYAGKEPLALAGSAAAPEDITAVYYTSGTTGPPKGCMVGHIWWRRIADVEQRINPKTAADRTLCCLPFHYNDAPILLTTALNSGGAVVVMRRFSVSRFWTVVRDNAVTQFVSLGPMPALLLKGEPEPQGDESGDRGHGMKHVHVVGVPLDQHAELVARFGCHWIDSYATSESGFITRVPLDRAAEFVGSGSVGMAVPEVEIRLLDDHGRDVSEGEIGEYVVRAPGMFSGYLGNEAATSEAMVGGWYRTGDRGQRDPDGRYYFAGRKKDIVRRSGENFAAAEVETVLRAHSKVLEAAIIPVPDPLRGEEAKAFILPVAGESMESLSPEALVAHCEGRLAAFKIPRYFEYRREDFPRTPTLRVRKELLRLERADPILGCWDRETGKIVTEESDDG